MRPVYCFCLVFVTAGCSSTITPGEHFDAGPVFPSRTKTVEHTFRVVNTTGRHAKIKEVKPACSCSSASLGSNSLAAGASTTLVLRVDVPNTYREWDVGCRLITDDPRPQYKNWDFELSFRAYIPARLDPATIDLGTIEKSSSKGRRLPMRVGYVELFSMADEPTPQGTWALPNSLVTKRLNTPTIDRLEDGRIQRARYKVEFQMTEEALQFSGGQSRSISFDLEGNQSAAGTVSWSVIPTLITDPASLHFGLIDAAQHEDRSVTLRAIDGRTFRVVEAEVSGKHIVLKRNEADSSRSSHRFSVSFQGVDGQSRALSGGVIFRTDDPGLGDITVPWSVLIREPTAIAARVCGMGFICDPGVACAGPPGICPNTLPYVSVVTSPANVRSCEKSIAGTCNNTVPQTCAATFFYSGAGCTGDINCFNLGTPFNGCDDNS